MKDLKDYLWNCEVKGLLKNGFIIQKVQTVDSSENETFFFKNFKLFRDEEELYYGAYDVIDVIFGNFSVPYFFVSKRF